MKREERKEKSKKEKKKPEERILFTSRESKCFMSDKVDKGSFRSAHRVQLNWAMNWGTRCEGKKLPVESEKLTFACRLALAVVSASGKVFYPPHPRIPPFGPIVIWRV